MRRRQAGRRQKFRSCIEERRGARYEEGRVELLHNDHINEAMWAYERQLGGCNDRATCRSLQRESKVRAGKKEKGRDEGKDTYENARRGAGATERVTESCRGSSRVEGRGRGSGRRRLTSHKPGCWRRRSLACDEMGILLVPNAFDLGDEVGCLVAEIAVLPRTPITDAPLAALEFDSAGFCHVVMSGSFGAVLEQLATSFAVNTFGDAVLVPRGTIDDAQASLCKIFVSDPGSACIVLALKKVPPFLLGSAGTEIKVFAGAEGFECILNAKLLDVAVTLLVAMHARDAVLVVLVAVIGRSNIGHGEMSLGVDSVKNLVKCGLTGKRIWASGHDCERDIDSFHSEGVLRL